jgi:hypothetical protein
MKPRYLLFATRHMKRIDDSEIILPSEQALAARLSDCAIDIAKDNKRTISNLIAYTSGYKSHGDMNGRTENTAAAFGFESFAKDKELSYSPKVGWEEIPFGEWFSVFAEKYHKSLPTKDMADRHAIEYRNIMKSLAVIKSPIETNHLFTHDSRIEAACAVLMPQYADRLGGPLDYGETLVMRVDRNYVFEPVAIVRRTGIQEI